MKNFIFLKIMAVLFISFFSINETNAQCIPDAGVDTATCGLVYTLDAIPQNSGATAQWIIFSQPTGSSVVFGDGTAGSDQEFNVDVYVTEYGVYEFVIVESSGACTDYDTILVEFIRIPQISAGDDQYICGWRAQMEAQMDPSGNSVGGSWANAPLYWTDSIFWNTTVDTVTPIVEDANQQVRPNAYITNPVNCNDSVMMIWQEYSVGDVFTNHQCYAKDTVMLFFYADIQADDDAISIESEVCGREVELTTSNYLPCGSGYWIDSLSIVVNWNPSNTSPNTTATVADYGTDAFAYVIVNGIVPGSNYPVCMDTSEFHQVTFYQKPEVDACPGCYRLENTMLPDGNYAKSVRTDTVCFNSNTEFYMLSPLFNLGDPKWSKSSSGLIFANGDYSGNISYLDNDSVYVNIYNSAGLSGNDYYTLVFSSTIANICETRDTLLLSIAKNPSAEIGFRRPNCHNQSAKVWAEDDTEVNPTTFNWTFSDNPIIDSAVVSTTDSIYYLRWNQTDCDSLEHIVSLQTSSDWGCYSQINMVVIKDQEIVVPLTDNIQPTTGMNDGVIRLVADSMVGCDGSFEYSYYHCWIASTLQEDLANNIPSFDEQINFGAFCVVDSLYGLLVQDSTWLVYNYVSLLSLDTDYIGTSASCRDTIMLQVGNNTTVEEIDFNKILKIYPNPAKEQLTVVGLAELNINKIEILDISGKVLKTINVNQISKEFKINISDLNEGIYFIKLGNYVGKFVKQ